MQLQGLSGLLDTHRWELYLCNPQVSNSASAQCNATVTKQYLESTGEAYDDFSWLASSSTSLCLPDRVSSEVL